MNRIPFLLVAVVALSVAPVIRAASGHDIFIENCAACHGIDGKGQTPAGKKFHAKDLAESKLSDADITKQVLNGTSDRTGKVRMPSFKATLSQSEITAVVAFVKTFRR